MTRWRTTYFVVANTAILLWLVLLGTDAALRTYIHVVTPLWWGPGPSAPVLRNYAHMTPDDRDELLRNGDLVRFRYAPVVGLTQDTLTSRFVNIDEHGIRANGPVPRDIAALQQGIWFLGGSTTFGDGVADHETIPAQLERLTRRTVVNLGVSNYSSTQENLQLNHYLRIGYRPTLAIFLDGINETCAPDLYGNEMNILVRKAQKGYGWEPGEPVIHAAAWISRKTRRLMGLGVNADRQSLICVDHGQQNALRTIHARTMAEREALCRLYNIECRTVVQPFAGVHGRRDGFETTFLEGGVKELRALFEHLEPSWREAGAIFVTDVLEQDPEHAFIDEVHYSAAASRLIAGAIAERLAIASNP